MSEGKIGIARCKNIRCSAQKMRLVVDQIRNKNVFDAQQILFLSKKKCAKYLIVLLNSAVANSGENLKKLCVGEIFADEGATLKRIRPGSRGNAMRILKRTSNVTVKVRAIGDM